MLKFRFRKAMRSAGQQEHGRRNLVEVEEDNKAHGVCAERPKHAVDFFRRSHTCGSFFAKCRCGDVFSTAQQTLSASSSTSQTSPLINSSTKNNETKRLSSPDILDAGKLAPNLSIKDYANKSFGSHPEIALRSSSRSPEPHRLYLYQNQNQKPSLIPSNSSNLPITERQRYVKKQRNHSFESKYPKNNADYFSNCFGKKRPAKSLESLDELAETQQENKNNETINQQKQQQNKSELKQERSKSVGHFPLNVNTKGGHKKLIALKSLRITSCKDENYEGKEKDLINNNKFVVNNLSDKSKEDLSLSLNLNKCDNRSSSSSSSSKIYRAWKSAESQESNPGQEQEQDINNLNLNYNNKISIGTNTVPRRSETYSSFLSNLKHPDLITQQDWDYNAFSTSVKERQDTARAEKFLQEFGLFGPMGNGVGSVRKTSVDSDSNLRKNSKLVCLDTKKRNGLPDDYQYLKTIVPRLEKELSDLEVGYGSLQTELAQTKKELENKEQEVTKLQCEIHKLKSVLQQTTASQNGDILASIQEQHGMANRVPALPHLNNNSAAKKQGVSAESSEFCSQPGDIALVKHDKDFRSKQLIKEAILDNDFLKHLDSSQIREIVDCMYLREFPKGAYVIREGEAGAHLFVSAEGSFEVIKDGSVLGSMGPKKAFGELAILYNCTRTASIRVMVDSKVWVLDRKVFQQIMMRTGLQRLQDNIKFLRSVSLLQNLSTDVLTKIADVLEVEFYPSGAYIIRQGASGDTFFIISSGSVKITQRALGRLEEEEIRTLQRGDYFGEQALLKEDCRTASVIALPPGVECLTLDRDSFIQLIGDLSEIKEKDYGDNNRTLVRPTSSTNVCAEQEYEYMKLDDLDVIATLGVGGFGRVELVQYSKNPSETFALKCLKKQHIVDTQQQDHVFSERNIMLQCRSPFICRLYRTFRDSKYVYMLLEACLGGEVWTILRDRGSFDEHTTKFITACVIEAFEYLHARGIIYRDLKPENLLLNSQGYVKLVDFGFSKRLGYSSKTWTFCGTPEYVAPETILNKGHDRAVDYWALGILMHELLTGNPPFTATDPMRTYNLILKGIDMIDFAKYNVSRSAQSLIKKLCRDLPSERLGYQRGGIQDIKKHKWFQSWDWEGLRARSLPAPIVHNVKCPADHSNFDSFEKDNDIPPDEFSNWDLDF